MTDSYESAWYGTWKRSPDEPFPTPDSDLYPPSIYVSNKTISIPVRTVANGSLQRIHMIPIGENSLGMHPLSVFLTLQLRLVANHGILGHNWSKLPRNSPT